MTTTTDPNALSDKLRQIRALIAESKLFPQGYDDVFERRTRFGAARIVISAQIEPAAKADRAAALLGFGAFERRWFRVLLSLGAPGRIAALAWATLRTRPMSFMRLLSQWPRRRAIVAACAAYDPA
jgi:hypothetical protein